MMLFWWILVQILGESLPISSSSHVQLMYKILNFFGVPYEQFADLSAIDFLLHGPTILILLFYFFTIWWSLIFHEPFKFQIPALQKLLRPMLFVCLADIITFLFWFFDVAHSSWAQLYFLPIGLCITAGCLLLSRHNNVDKKINWSLHDAAVLGLVQGVSLMPGISRFAATYAAGTWLGYGRTQSFALSFMMQLPLLCAGFLKGLLALHHTPQLVETMVQGWVVCTIVFASLASYRLFCWVAMLIKQNRLWYFAFYMIIPIVLSIAL